MLHFLIVTPSVFNGIVWIRMCGARSVWNFLPPMSILEEQVMVAQFDRHVEHMNAAIKKRGASRKRARESEVVAFSDFDKRDLDGIYGVIKRYKQDVDPISKETLQSLTREVKRHARLTGLPGDGASEKKKKTYIFTMLSNVADEINGDDPDEYDVDSADSNRVFVEEEMSIEGININARGIADFVVRRGTRMVIVVEAKKEDMEQGLIQDLISMDVAIEQNLAKDHKTPNIYGIVTDFTQWWFVRRVGGVVEKTTDCINFENSLEADLERIAGKIRHMIVHS